MKYYKCKLLDKRTGEVVMNQKGYTKDIIKAMQRFAKQNAGAGIYATIDLEEITEEEFKALPKEW